MVRRKTTQRDPLGRVQSEFEEEENEDSAFDRRGLLKDGRSTRIPLYLKDGSPNPHLSPVQRSIAATHQPLVVDGSSKPNAMHRPGFRYLADANRRAINDAVKNEAYQEVDRRDANAWKGATNRTNLRDAQEGDPCTVRGPEYPEDFGSPGTLQMGSDGLVCVPDDSQQDARRSQDAVDAKRAAYEEYDRVARDAWRTGK